MAQQGLVATNSTQPSVWSSRFLLLTAILLSSYLWVFWPTLATMEGIWRHSETYMHGYLIVPISLWLLYRQRSQLMSISPQPTLLPTLLAVPLLVVWLMAYSININFVSQFAAIIYLQLLLWSLFGHHLLKQCWFPIGFLIFMVPFGEAANPVLQQITADLVVAMLHLINMPVYRDGLYLHTASAVFEVAVACSGLNFLLSSLVLSCLFAYLHYTKWLKALLFVSFVLVLSIIANGIRAFLLVVIGETTQLTYGFGADHYYYGWLVFFIVMFCSFWLGAKFSDEANQTTANTDQELSNVNIATPHRSNLTGTTQRSTKSIPWSMLVIILPLLLTAYVRYTLPETTPPTPPARLFSHVEIQPSQNHWGIRFADGLSRDHWQENSGIEYFIATYANRQTRGDMITWHNTLFATDRWTIRQHERVGELTNSYGVLHLVNSIGQTREIHYWYQLGSVKTTNRVLVKLMQLSFLWLQRPEPAKIFAVSANTDHITPSPERWTQARKQLAANVASALLTKSDEAY